MIHPAAQRHQVRSGSRKLVAQHAVDFRFNVCRVAADDSVTQERLGRIAFQSLLSFDDSQFSFDLICQFRGSGEVGVVEHRGVGF